VVLQNSQPVVLKSKTLTPPEQKVISICTNRERVPRNHVRLPLLQLIPFTARQENRRIRPQAISISFQVTENVIAPTTRAYLASKWEKEEEFQVFALEVVTLNTLDSFTFLSERLAQSDRTRCRTPKLDGNDVGRPELKSEVPIPVQEYWNYWEEISLHNGILFKGQRIIIPKVIQTRNHYTRSHKSSCLRKARAFIVLWPRTNSNIK